MKKILLSVFIITRNEEQRLPATLQSVKGWVDEIIVVDSGSTDSTTQIARSHGAITYFNEWQGYGQQKIFAEQKCKNKWLLNIDADEVISKGLRDNILTLFENGKLEKSDAYKIKWKLVFMGSQKPPRFASGGEVTRLYNKLKAGFRDDRVHDSVIAKDGRMKTSNLKGVIFHKSFRDYSHWIDKINFISDEQSAGWIEKGRKPPSVLRIIFEPMIVFIKLYFFRRYCVYGIHGFIGSVVGSTGRLVRLAKVLERYEGSKKKK